MDDATCYEDRVQDLMWNVDTLARCVLSSYPNGDVTVKQAFHQTTVYLLRNIALN